MNGTLLMEKTMNKWKLCLLIFLKVILVTLLVLFGMYFMEVILPSDWFEHVQYGFGILLIMLAGRIAFNENDRNNVR